MTAVAATVHTSEAVQQLTDWLRDVVLAVAPITQESAETAAAYARANPHLFKPKTGELQRSMRGVLVERGPTRFVARIIADAKHARFVYFGTKPHEIRPKEGHGFTGPLQAGQSRRAKTDIGTHRVALRWVSGGRVHFARVVHHPGTRPRPFFDDAQRYGAEHLGHRLDAMLDTNTRRYRVGA